MPISSGKFLWQPEPRAMFLSNSCWRNSLTSRSTGLSMQLREQCDRGAFSFLIAGDGIREDIAALAELINRNAASAFSLGMMEVALYALGESLVIQPRIIARTSNIERSVVVVRSGTEVLGTDEPQDEEDNTEPSRSSASAERGLWWATLNDLTFDDPEQQPARFVWPNNL